MNREKIWDSIAAQWHHLRQSEFKPVYDFIKIYKPRRGKILEIGCGNARNLIPFASKGFDCYGLDFSQKMLDKAKENAIKNQVKIILFKSDMIHLPFKNGYFDYILFPSTLHHADTEEKRILSLQEAYRVLKKNGLLLLTVWNKLQFRFLFRPKNVTVPWHINKKRYDRFYHLFDYFELKQLVKKSHFKILKSNILGNNLIFILKK